MTFLLYIYPSAHASGPILRASKLATKISHHQNILVDLLISTLFFFPRYNCQLSNDIWGLRKLYFTRTYFLIRSSKTTTWGSLIIVCKSPNDVTYNSQFYFIKENKSSELYNHNFEPLELNFNSDNLMNF